MAELFQVTAPIVNEHRKGIYAEGELAAGATIRKFRIVQLEGSRQVSRTVLHYSLLVILAVDGQGLGLLTMPAFRPCIQSGTKLRAPFDAAA